MNLSIELPTGTSNIGHACAICSKMLFAEPGNNAATTLLCNHKFHIECLQTRWEAAKTCPACLSWPIENSIPLRNEKIIISLQNKVCPSSAPKSVDYKACLECRQKKKSCFHINPNPRKRSKPGQACVKCKRLKRRCQGAPCNYCKERDMVCHSQPARASTKRRQNLSPSLPEVSPIMPTKPDNETMEMQSQYKVSEASNLDYMDSSWHQLDDLVMSTSPSLCHGGPQCYCCVNGDYRYQSLAPSFATYPVHNNPRPSTLRQQSLEVIATTAGFMETAQRRMSVNIKLILSRVLTEYELLMPAQNEAFHYGGGLFEAAWLRQFVVTGGDMEALSIICQLGAVLFKLFDFCSESYQASENLKLLSVFLEKIWQFLEDIRQCFQIELCDSCYCEFNNLLRNDSSIFSISRDTLQSYLIWRISMWYGFICLQHKNCLGSGHGVNLNGLAEKIPDVLKRFLYDCGFSDNDYFPPAQVEEAPKSYFI